MSECQAAVAEIEACASKVSGVVHVSLNEVPYELHVLMAMRLRERHPCLEVVLASMPPIEALAALRVGALDVVLSMEWDCRPATAAAGMTRHASPDRLVCGRSEAGRILSPMTTDPCAYATSPRSGGA